MTPERRPWFDALWAGHQPHGYQLPRSLVRSPSRLLVKNISNVSNFAQTDGAGPVFNQSSLAEGRTSRQAGSRVPSPHSPQARGHPGA